MTKMEIDKSTTNEEEMKNVFLLRYIPARAQKL